MRRKTLLALEKGCGKRRDDISVAWLDCSADQPLSSLTKGCNGANVFVLTVARYLVSSTHALGMQRSASQCRAAGRTTSTTPSHW
jgi:hypothetical protein